MARSHKWYYLLNEEGQPIESATVNIYQAGTVTSAWYYTQETGGSSIQTAITTDSNGYFEFWIANSNETNGYENTQKFKILWSKTGIASGNIDNVDVLPMPDTGNTSTKTDDYSVLVSDFGKSLRMNSAGNKTFTLPGSVPADYDGEPFTFIKLGAGKLTIQASANQTISDSSIAGTIENANALEIYASVKLEYVYSTTQWILIGGDGNWTTT